MAARATIRAQKEAPPASVGEEQRWPPPQGQWTYEDWLRLPDDGWQYEIIKGVLYMVPAPTTTHQRISLNLVLAIGLFARQKRIGEVFNAPTDVYLPGQETPVQPDLLFIAAERRGMISDRGIEGAPDLVVEILSQKTWWRDRRVKMPLYEETGVQEYWLADPETCTVEVYTLRGTSYVLVGHWGPTEIVRSEVLQGFEIAIDDVFATVS